MFQVTRKFGFRWRECRAYRTGESLKSSTDIEFVWIPPGEFRMGSTSRHAGS